MSTQAGTAPITGAVLTRLFEFSYNVTRGNVEGFTHEDSLTQPKLSGNCLNWVVGHIVATRNHILALLGKPPFWSEEEIARYDRGSNPIVTEDEAVPWDRIMKDFDRSQEMLRAEFGSGSDNTAVLAGKKSSTTSSSKGWAIVRSAATEAVALIV